MKNLVPAILFLFIVPVMAISESSGVVVTRVEASGAGAEAGIQVGDLLRRWRVLDGDHKEEGELYSPWSFIVFEQEYAGGFSVELIGQRDGEALVFNILPPWSWGMQVHPLLHKDDHEKLQKGMDLIKSNLPQEGIKLFHELASRLGNSVERSAWFLYRASQALARAGALQDAILLLEEALQNADQIVYSDQIHAQLSRLFLSNAALKKSLIHAERAVANHAGHGLGLARFHVLQAKAHLRLMQLDTAEEVFKKAEETCLRLAPKSMVIANVFNGLGSVAIRRGKLDLAEKYYLKAWDLHKRHNPSTLLASGVAHNLGVTFLNRGKLIEADMWLERALALRQSLAPDSLTLAGTMVTLGIVALRRGQIAAVEKYAGQAVTIQQRHAPGSQSEAFGLELLGAAARERGDLALAERSFQRVLEIREPKFPGGLRITNTLSNLGAVAHERGDLMKAENYYRRALAIQHEKAPGSRNEASYLNNIGSVLWNRQELEAAESYLRQAITIYEKLAPDSVYVAKSYVNLAGLIKNRGRHEEAMQLMNKAGECFRAAGSHGLDTAAVLGYLASWKMSGGDLDGAEPLMERSLEIREQLAPGSTSNAVALQSMGQLAELRGQIVIAENYYRRTTTMLENRGVTTLARAETWELLGSLLRAAGRRNEAKEAYYQAIVDLEGVVGRLGGLEDAHSNFRAQHQKKYQNLIDLLVEMKQGERAFHMLERSRARGFLNLLEQRDLMFTVDISEELDRERRMTRAEVERKTIKISQLPDSDIAQKDKLQQSLQLSKVRLREIQEQIRADAPRLARLTAPQPLELKQCQLALDEGTVALSYAVGPKSTQLFVVGPGKNDFQVATLEIGEVMLRRKIRRLRNALSHPTSGLETIHRVSSDLSSFLLAPAADEILRAHRVLIVPDGPLHLLPFAVLTAPGGDGYFIESKPIHYALSLTVFAELKAERRRPSERHVSGFGAPRYPTGTDELISSSLLCAYTHGALLPPLPWSRKEVISLRDLFPDVSNVWIGSDATEDRARREAGTSSILHFACHALVNENQPLESALILTIPETPREGAHNGLLQAWEIIESVRLDADLVVLSACRTALGRELAGEGIVGLTRAFQFAGARSVLASLWQVADQSTAVLMSRFYNHLASGSHSDEAMRAAQLELISEPINISAHETFDASHPYFWAAFQLNGDWK